MTVVFLAAKPLSLDYTFFANTGARFFRLVASFESPPYPPGLRRRIEVVEYFSTGDILAPTRVVSLLDGEQTIIELPALQPPVDQFGSVFRDIAIRSTEFTDLGVQLSAIIGWPP